MIFLGIVCVLIAVALIFVVVVQNSKGGGLSSTFGGTANQILGARRSNEFIEKVTWYLAVGLAVIAFAANVAGTASSGGSKASRLTNAIETQVITAPTQQSLPDPASFAVPAEAPEEE